jgi:ABC-2 type transport system permease protein
MLSSFATQLWDLLLMELTNWRWSWRAIVLTSVVAPMLGIIALGSFASGPETLAYILTGNIVMAIMFSNLQKVASRFAYMRFMGTLDYYATLPIQRTALIVAVVLSFFLLSLPTLVAVMAFGSFFLQLPLQLNPLLLLVIPLSVLSLAGLGAAIGAIARTPEEAGSLSLLLAMTLLFIGPVLIPESRLPPGLVAIGHLSPATYAAAALRQVLLEPLSSQVAANLGALAGFSGMSLWLAGHQLDWRQR